MASISDQPTTTQHQSELIGIVGLQNMGNTCYLNSTIQILRAVPELSAYCKNTNIIELCDEKKDTNYAKILLGYQELVNMMWSTNKPAFVRPLAFITLVQHAVKDTVYSMFGLPIPNDSHEFLVYLLDNFHEALSKKIHIPDIRESQSEPQSMTTLAQHGWSSFLRAGHSPIVDLFFGMMRKTIECQNCHNKTYQWEVFNILKIPCQGATFIEWIENECSVTSELTDYDCVNCRPSRVNAKIYSHIWCLPQILFIAIRRFKPTGQKDMSPCPYSGETLNLNAYFAEESTEQSKTWKYELYSIVDHHGTHTCGHYITQFRHPQTSEWWMFDDERGVKLEHPCFGGSNYLFLFRRQCELLPIIIA